MHKLKSIYESPEATLIGLHAEQIICGSPWYQQGGEGDFNYDVETDNTFA